MIFAQTSLANINLLDASFTHSTPDSFGMAADPKAIARTYHSRSLHLGLFGFGWCTEYERWVQRVGPEEVILRSCEQSSPLKFRLAKKGARKGLFFYAKNGKRIALIQGEYRFQDSPRGLYTFNRKGHFISRRSEKSSLVLDRDSKGRLVGLREGSVRIEFHYATNSRKVIRVSNEKGDDIRYTYKGHDLVEAHSSLGWKKNYGYDRFHNLTWIRRDGRTTNRMTYNADLDRVTAHWEVDHCTTFVDYSPSSTPRIGIQKVCDAENTISGEVQFNQEAWGRRELMPQAINLRVDDITSFTIGPTGKVQGLNSTEMGSLQIHYHPQLKLPTRIHGSNFGDLRVQYGPNGKIQSVLGEGSIQQLDRFEEVLKKLTSDHKGEIWTEESR